MKHTTLITMMLALGLIGCHNTDQDKESTSTPTKNVTVTPSLGQISNAAIKAICSGTQTAMGQANIGANGAANLTLTGNCSSPILFELVATANSQYYDEATSSMLALPVGTVLRVAAPSLQTLAAMWA